MTALRTFGTSRRLRIVLLAWLALGVTRRASAQDATIIGTVADTTKASLPGVLVTATSADTGRQSATVSDGEGAYRLAQLSPGRYRLQAELAGFSTVNVASVELLVGQNATVPFVMKLAQLNEPLTVTGEAPLVDTSSSQVVGQRRPAADGGSCRCRAATGWSCRSMVKGITANDIVNTPGVGATTCSS